MKKRRIINYLLICLFLLMCGYTNANALAASPENDIRKARYSFVLFYMHSCVHCQRFDPILRRFAARTHRAVLAYTLDRQSLPSFPQSLNPTQEELNKFFPTNNVVVPTLFLMDSEMHRIYPVLQGEATMAQLQLRVNQLIQSISHSFTNSHTEFSTDVAAASAAQEQDFNYENR